MLESHGIIVSRSKYVASEIDAFSPKVRLGKGRRQGDVYTIAVAVGEKPIERLRFDRAHDIRSINQDISASRTSASGSNFGVFCFSISRNFAMLRSHKTIS